MGTRMWARGEIVWCINSNIIIMGESLQRTQ